VNRLEAYIERPTGIDHFSDSKVSRYTKCSYKHMHYRITDVLMDRFRRGCKGNIILFLLFGEPKFYF